MPKLVLSLIALLLSGGLLAAPASDLTVTATDLTVAPALPLVGQPALLRVRVANPLAGQTRPVAVRLEVRPLSAPGQSDSFSLTAPALEPGQEALLEAPWQPLASGFYSLTAHLPGTDSETSAEVTIAVVDRPVVIAWYGHAKHLRWVTHLTRDYSPAKMTAATGDHAYWAWRGCVASSSAGVGASRSEEELVQQYLALSARGYPGVALDESNWAEQDTESSLRMARLLEETRRRAPPGFHLAVWFAGSLRRSLISPSLLRQFEAADLILPETYLSYSAYDPTALYTLAASLRRVEMLPKTAFSLDLYGEDLTPACLEAQLRHLKRAAPESPGVGFFWYGVAAPGIPQAVDDLCRKYVVAPVLTLGERAVRRSSAGARARLEAAVDNCGAMTSHGGHVTFFAGDPRAGGQPLTEPLPLPTIAAGSHGSVSATVRLPAAARTIWARLTAPEPITVLDSLAKLAMPGAPQGLEEAPVRQPVGGNLLAGQPQLAAATEKIGRTAHLVKRTDLPSSEGRSFALSFDLDFQRTAYYGVIAVGADSDRDRSALAFSVYRGGLGPVLTVSQCSATGAKTSRSFTHNFRPQEKLTVVLRYEALRQTFGMSVDQGKTRLWDSGELESFGPMSVDRLSFAVRLGKETPTPDKSTIVWEAEQGGRMRLVSAVPSAVEALVTDLRLSLAR